LRQTSGIRRATELHLASVPVFIHAVPAGEDPDEYRRRLRFILDQHRQDLKPSQKAELMATLKRTFQMTHRQVAAYLGIDADSVTNWLAIKSYIPPIVDAIDSGRLTMASARTFVGLTTVGQANIWEKHGSDLMQSTGATVHRKLRAQYSPDRLPNYYREPEVIKERLSRKTGKRKSATRASFTPDEKKRLLNSYELKEQELADGQDELKQLKREIAAATPVVAAIIRNERLRSLVPSEMMEELERFAEIYV
jgi:hypothetical protein